MIRDDALNRRTKTVVDALIEHAKRIHDEPYKPLTWDRGHELAAHKRFNGEKYADVYFCDPQSPLQGGMNENTNRLLRQYRPKGTDLSLPHTSNWMKSLER